MTNQSSEARKVIVNDMTELIFVLDRSGSMGGLENVTISGFNELVQQQRYLGETLVTAVLFDDQYEILWNGIPADEAKLTRGHYYVRGTTALLDAVGKTILDVGQRLSRTPEQNRPAKVIVVITTDGMENASREFTYKKVKELINHQQEKYSWEFIFMGANIDAAAEATNLGIQEDSAYGFQASHEGIEVMYNTVCEALSEKRRS
ncbi:vWA domain-containing protein [Desulfuribacillus alkaliarsenatis]|uniref:VWFA domain-containing protein n=1 Tax=Desulfuribacillus alkaliarsenatis TaxID=766136 RepID=A0A1E5G214_9FIRM|nr:vWA domain-containing protein [Desulfuribacillus alkaliarsenatis]OEF96569.1 hypothetical protein BHF68_07950 [Desulfuribacillus alkaliarsenatis]